MNLCMLWNGAKAHADPSFEVSACPEKLMESSGAKGRLIPQHDKG